MTAITHLLHRTRDHPIGVALGAAAGGGLHRWLATRSSCVPTFLQECTPRPSVAVPALIAFVAVGALLGIVVAGALRDRPGDSRDPR